MTLTSGALSSEENKSLQYIQQDSSTAPGLGFCELSSCALCIPGANMLSEFLRLSVRSRSLLTKPLQQMNKACRNHELQRKVSDLSLQQDIQSTLPSQQKSQSGLLDTVRHSLKPKVMVQPNLVLTNVPRPSCGFSCKSPQLFRVRVLAAMTGRSERGP